MKLKIDNIGFLYAKIMILFALMFYQVSFATDLDVNYSENLSSHTKITEQLPLWQIAQIYEDESGLLGIHDVAQLDTFEEMYAHPQLGHTRSKFWFKIDLVNSLLDMQDEFFIHIDNPIIDNIEVYRFSFGQTNPSFLYHLGDTFPYSQRPINNQDFIIPILNHQKGDQYFIRIWGKSPMMIPSYISDKQGLIDSPNFDSTFSFFISGVILSMVLYNLFLFFGTRIAVYGWYVVYVGNVYAYTLFTSGIGFRYIWPSSPQLESILAYLFIAGFQWASFKFTRSFLQIKQFYPRVDTILYVISYIPLVTFFTIFFNVSIAIVVLSLTTFLIVFVIPIISIMVLRKGFAPSLYFLISWMFLIVGMSIYNATVLGALPIMFFTMHAIELGVAFESVLLSLALAHRIKSMENDKEIKEINARKQLEQAYKSTESALALANASNQAKNAFLSNISHNVKTPIHAFYGNIQLLFNSDLDDQQKEKLESAKDNAMQLFYYIDNLLTYSEILGNDIVPLETKANIENEVLEIVDAWQKNSGDQTIHIVVNIDSSLPSTVYSEWVHVKKVLRVLFDSLVTGSRNKELTLFVSGQMQDVEGSIVMSVSGLHIQDQQIVDNWVKEDISADVWEGLGLEYYVGRKLIEVLGARLTYTEDARQIGQLNFEFPGRLAKDEYSSESRSNFPNVNVLVVDDNLVNIQVMCAMLSKLGAVTESAMSGEEALHKIRSGDYDIILMDCLMPGLSGQDTAKNIRELHSSNQNTPIIAVSANASDKDRESCINSGMNDFMSKPVRLEKLAKYLTRWVPEY